MSDDGCESLRAELDKLRSRVDELDERLGDEKGEAATKDDVHKAQQDTT